MNDLTIVAKKESNLTDGDKNSLFSIPINKVT